MVASETLFDPPLPALARSSQGQAWSDFIHHRGDSVDSHRLENYSWRLWHMRHINLTRLHDHHEKIQENRQFRRWAVDERHRRQISSNSSPGSESLSHPSERSRASSLHSEDLNPPQVGKALIIPAEKTNPLQDPMEVKAHISSPVSPTYVPRRISKLVQLTIRKFSPPGSLISRLRSHHPESNSSFHVPSTAATTTTLGQEPQTVKTQIFSGWHGIPKAKTTLKRSNSMDGSRDSFSARVGEGTTLFDKPPSFDGLYLRQLLVSPSTILRRQTWLLLAKYSTSLYRERPHTLAQCADALFVASSNVPSPWRDQVSRDVPRTCLHPFLKSAEGQQRLQTILIAHSDWNSAVGYCQSVSYVCAILLVAMDPINAERYGPIHFTNRATFSSPTSNTSTASRTVGTESLASSDETIQLPEQEFDDAEVLLVLRALVDVYLPENFYSGQLKGLVAEVLTLNKLIEIHLPVLFQHLTDVTLAAEDEPSVASGEFGSKISILDPFLVRWLSTLFANSIPLAFAIRVFDAILCDGIEILHRVALAVLSEMQPALLTQHEFYDCCDVIKDKCSELHQGMLIQDPEQLLLNAYTIGGLFPWQGFHALRAKCHKEQASSTGFAAATAALAEDSAEVAERKRMDRFWSEMAML